jgi:PAS domain S-box-containing protein
MTPSRDNPPPTDNLERAVRGAPVPVAAGAPASRPPLRGAIGTFLFLFLGIGTAGFFYARHQLGATHQKELDAISAVADLKIQNILAWREERLSDARSLMAEPFVSHAVREFLTHPAHDAVRAPLLAWLASARTHNQSLRAVLLDPQLTVRLTVPEDQTYVGPTAAAFATEALRTRQVVLSDLHFSRFSGELHFDLAIPLVPSSAPPTSATAPAGDASAEPVGVLVLEVDPCRHLFPIIQSWPTPSPTAETLLVRREGDEVVFLNELRHRAGTALVLRARLDQQPPSVCTLAARGQHGAVEGVDYRQVPVLGVTRPVPGTPWFLVAKEDLAEFQVPLQAQTRATGIVLFIMIVAAALSVCLGQRRRGEQWLRRQLVSERERTQALEALHETRQRLEAILEVTRTGIDVVDGDFNLHYVDPGWRKVYGDPAGKKCYAYFMGRDRPCPRCGIPRALATKQVQVTEETLPRENNRIIEVRSIPFQDVSGQWLVSELNVDITARKQAEDALRASETRTRAITDSAQDAILMMDPEGRVSYWNPAAETIFGYTRDEALGQSLHAFIVPQRYHAAHHAAFPEFQRSGQGAAVGHTLELEARRKDGREIAVALSLSAIQIGGGWHAIGILRDVTAQKQTEAALLETNRCLEEATARANSMAAEAAMANVAKSEFLANMSHEIRTPMTAILGYADLIAESVGCCTICPTHATCAIRGTNRQHVQTISRNGQQLLSLINDILDLSKIEADKMTTEAVACSPHAIVAEVAALVRVRAEAKQLAFNAEFIGPIPETLRTDPLRLRQILLNLLGNALKFTETGGVRLLTRLAVEDGEPRMQFDVIDTGIGITAAQADRLFQPFSQADTSTTRQFGGTGLGLTISKRLAQLLGGDVYLVDSRKSLGTRFRAMVATGPLEGVRMIEGDRNEQTVAVCSSAASAPRAPEVPTQALHGVRILLAEDGPDNQRLITLMLQKAGAEVTLVGNGRLAVEAALEARDAGRLFDVILMDMQMPELDGYHAAGRLRRQRYVGPIIALTAHAMDGDRQKCLDAGCDGYTSKPVGHRKLIDLIQAHLVPSACR